MQAHAAAVVFVAASALLPASAQQGDPAQTMDTVSQSAAESDTRPPARPEQDLKDASPAAIDDPEDPSSEPPAATARDAATAPIMPAGPPAWQLLAETPAAYQSCLFGAALLGVGYEEIAPVTGAKDRDCGIARPLRVTDIQPGISIAGGAEMRCATALRLALWVRNELSPAVRLLRRGAALSEIRPGSTYQCRERVGGSSEKLSEHALGNAFDVMGLGFSDGTELSIAPRDATGTMEEAVQKAVRHGACLYFTTVLGPGSNAAHDDHLHFDIAARNGDWRLCE